MPAKPRVHKPQRRLTDTPEYERHWHLDKRVSIANIVALFVMALGLFQWGSSIERRISIVENTFTTQKEFSKQQEIVASDNLRLVREEIKNVREEVKELRHEVLDSSTNTTTVTSRRR